MSEHHVIKMYLLSGFIGVMQRLLKAVSRGGNAKNTAAGANKFAVDAFVPRVEYRHILREFIRNMDLLPLLLRKGISTGGKDHAGSRAGTPFDFQF